MGEHGRAVGAMDRHSGGHNIGFGFDNVCIYTLLVARHASKREQVSRATRTAG